MTIRKLLPAQRSMIWHKDLWVKTGCSEMCQNVIHLATPFLFLKPIVLLVPT